MSSQSGSGLFGNSTGAPNTSSASGGTGFPFPNPTNSVFNSSTSKSPGPPFGATPAPGSSAPSLDGQQNTGSGIFGSQSSGSATPASPGMFSGGATANKPPPLRANTGSVFGQQTPAPGTGGSYSGYSTTPAGLPPSAAVKPGIFSGGGGGNTSSAGGLFAPGAAQANTGTTNLSGYFGSPQQAQQAQKAQKSATGGLFGGGNTAASSAPATRSLFSSTQAAPGGLFGGNTQTSNAGSTPAAPAPTAGTLFSVDSKPAGAPPRNPIGSTTPAAKPPPGVGLFSGTPAAASTTPASPAPSSQAPSLFRPGKTPTGNPFSGQPPSAAAATAAAAPTVSMSSGGLFTSNSTPPSLFGAPPASKPTDAPTASTAPPLGGLFSKPTPSAPPAASTPTTSMAPAGSLFGPTTTCASQTAKTPVVQTPCSATTAPENPAAPTAFNTSMAPPPQSRLKNKSMEEIITRWTTDLEKHKAEFVTQATEVNKWDSVLIENGDKIMTLFTETLEAEKTQGRMDTVLQQLESDQGELGTALDYYEAQIKDLFDAQMGGIEGMQPADQEREKAYHLAEKLDDQLQGMGSELRGMINEINRASTMINKTTNVDDPLSQIVKILNDHLSSLQWIDSHTTSIAEKIQEAQKKSRDAAGGSIGGDEDFFPNSSFRSMR